MAGHVEGDERSADHFPICVDTERGEMSIY